MINIHQLSMNVDENDQKKSVIPTESNNYVVCIHFLWTEFDSHALCKKFERILIKKGNIFIIIIQPW